MLLLRRLLKKTEFLTVNERRKRVMPRHLLTAAVLSNIIPFHVLNSLDIKSEELDRIAGMLNKPKPARRPPGAARNPNTVAARRQEQQVVGVQKPQQQ